MIILSATTDKIEAILTANVSVNHLPCYVSWRDRTSTTFVAGRTAINTNNTTAVDISGSPASSTQRVIDSLTIYNADTVNATVTIRLNANGTTYILFKCTLGIGELLMYQEGSGFYVVSNAGGLKNSTNQGTNATSSIIQTVVLGADVVNNQAIANTLQDVTGLSFANSVGSSYWFKFLISYTAALSSTGSRWTINGPAFTRLSYTSEYTLTATTSTRNGAVQAYDSPAACNATSVVAQNLAVIEGIISGCTNLSTLVARFASEVGGSAITAKAGSVLYYQQIV